MSRRAIRTTSRISFLLCGLISLFTAVPYVALRGIDLPVQSEWVVFVVALALVGVFSVVVGLLPRSWIAKACKKDRDDEQLFSAPLKLLGGFAAISYLVAVVDGEASVRALTPDLTQVKQIGAEARSSTHACAVSDVSREDDVRSPGGDNLLAAGTYERGGVRITGPHRGICTAGLR